MFAPHFSDRSEHFRRLPLADVALDAFWYNAHTTATEMLWMGVPLVTCMGTNVYARLAGSLLTFLGKEELVTHDADEYVSTAVTLALDSTKRQSIRDELATLRSHPAYSISNVARYLEAVYQQVVERYRGGRPVRSLDVTLPERQ